MAEKTQKGTLHSCSRELEHNQICYAFHLHSVVVWLTLLDHTLISFSKFAFCLGHLLLLFQD